MELTFVHQYSGDAPKRRRLAKACESCRTRKVFSGLEIYSWLDILLTKAVQKRCVHFAGAEAANGADDRAESVEDSTELNGISKPKSKTQTPSTTGAQQQTPPTSADGRAKFVSDLQPQSTLLNRPIPGDSSQKQPNDDIGVWVDRREWDALLKQKNDAANNADQAIITNSGFRHDQRPHSAVLGPLIDVYFKKIHPLLPLLDEDEFRRNHAGGIVPEPLVHAMCLVAAKDPEAEPHLKLSDSSVTIPPRQFCTILHASVTGALRVPVRFEKVTLIRILALTSLHSEGAEGAEEASLWLLQALHHAQTLGIHLGQQAAAPVGDDMIMKRLFWSLWVLDRTSAATNGRPIMMSDVDIAIEPFTPGESGFPAFEAWLKIAMFLNKIIDFYRPNNDMSATGWEDPYPHLEGIIDEVGGWQLSASILATIHLFYLTVGILSHRTRGVKELACGYASHIRQRLFAIEIVRLMNAPKSPTLHPLPILPYAISLALSVSYQHLRQSQFEHQQADARQDFRTACKILQSLRRTWCSADVMATLAKKVLGELDRAQDVTSFRIRRKDKHNHKHEDDLIPQPTACYHGGGPVQTLAAQDYGMDDTDGEVDAVATLGSAVEQQAMPNGFDLFNNMDDVFGTFMDPNYPLNLDDMSFIDDFSPFDWNAEISIGS